MDKEYIEVAFCNKPHGVRGEIKVTVYLDNNKDFFSTGRVWVK